MHQLDRERTKFQEPRQSMLSEPCSEVRVIHCQQLIVSVRKRKAHGPKINMIALQI